MPNNANARREKEKKKKDKKKKTDTPPLLKENTTSVDSSTLSLSFAEQEEQALSFVLVGMKKAIQENASVVQEKEWEWARTLLRVEHSRATTMDERLDMRRKFREEIRVSNQLVSREELKSHLDVAMIRAVLRPHKREKQMRRTL